MTLEEKKARLVELKAKLAQMKESASIDAERGGLQAAAERLMVDDPIAAFGLLDKSRALDIKEQQAGRAASPDAARQQLRISRDIAFQTANNQTLGQTERDMASAEARVYIEEMSKPNPSTQAAAERVSALYGNALTPTPTPTGDPKTDMEAKVKEELAKIQYKGKALDEKVAALNLAIDNAGLESGQKTSLKKYVSDLAAAKTAPPPAKKTDEEYIGKVWSDMDAATQKTFRDPASLYVAGVSNYKQGTYGTAIQNFIKTANPGEAVMADDVNMANKGRVSSGMSAILKRFGIDPSNDNVQDIARRLGITATQAIQNRLDALDTYTLTPAQKALFVKRYMSNVSPIKLSMNKNENNGDALIKTPISTTRGSGTMKAGTASDLDKELGL